MAVFTLSAFNEHLGNNFYIVVLKIFPQVAGLEKAKEVTFL